MADRLSVLPDDLLRRVLHFAPAREAVSTDALSRRWRHSLWRSSGAVNLEARLPEHDLYGYGPNRDHEAQRDRFCARRDAFVFAAGRALELADDPVTRLTLRVVGHNKDMVSHFLSLATNQYETLDVVADLLKHPAARRVEELRIDAVDSLDALMWFEVSHEYEVRSFSVGIYTLSIADLPSETLRVLELTNCSELTVADGDVAFPRLESLRLRHCIVPLDDLQRVIDAAPALAAVHLDSVLLRSRDISYNNTVPPEEGETLFLRGPAATSLVLDKCGWTEKCTVFAVEIYAPRLRRFRYRGELREFSLSPPAPNLAQVDLQFLPATFSQQRPNDRRDLQFLPGTISRPKPNEEDRRRLRHDTCARFWRFVHNFTGATELKLGVHHLEDIAVASEVWRAKLLPVLSNLDRLELEGVHRPTCKTASVAIANLLRCCPALRDLRLKLSNTRGDSSKRSQYRSDLEDSINRFKRHISSSMMEGDEHEDDDDGGGSYGEVSDLPALSGRSFECLRSSLRRVGLQFRHEKKTDCFGVKLIKFFAENAMVLQELCIDGGTEKIDEHMNPKVERWVANSCKRSTDFVVLPLKR